jgi:hypothetical protein
VAVVVELKVQEQVFHTEQVVVEVVTILLDLEEQEIKEDILLLKEQTVVELDFQALEVAAVEVDQVELMAVQLVEELLVVAVEMEQFIHLFLHLDMEEQAEVEVLLQGVLVAKVEEEMEQLEQDKPEILTKLEEEVVQHI